MTCRLPYHGADSVLVVDIGALRHMMKIVTGALRPDMAALRPDAPPAVVSLMQRCWAPEPRDRPSMEEAAQLLAAALEAFRGARAVK